MRTIELVDLPEDQRDTAVPVIIDSFEGIYRWHAKRTLHRIPLVRAARDGPLVVGVSMLERLTPDVGYVYYLAVRRSHRRLGIGQRLLDDALAGFERDGVAIVYAAAEEDNGPSIALFVSRGFRSIERDELSYRHGGLGAWGLRSRMMLVSGEVLLGRRLRPPPVRDAAESARANGLSPAVGTLDGVAK